MSTLARTSPVDRLDRAALAALQARRLDAMLAVVSSHSAFYATKLAHAGLVRGHVWRWPDDLAAIPFTTKRELVADQTPDAPWGTVMTEPVEHYTRYSHTSGTTGRALRWLDTPESWQWSIDCWKAVYGGARVTHMDRVVFAFSFGPFFGFWTAFDAASQLGALCVPGGGLSSQQRLSLIDAVRPTVICCTPTYALRLAEVAAQEYPAAWLENIGVRVLIVAGEPGGNIPATRARIESAWGARVIDHHGLTEVGPVSFECWESPGYMHLNEAEFLCEVIDPTTGAPVPSGTAGELVVTNLGRVANPVIRYRTGDLVIRDETPCACGRTFARLRGGVVARVDDMVTVRGVNVYPSAIEAIVRGFPSVTEFRTTIADEGALRSARLDIESNGPLPEADAQQVAAALRDAIGLTVTVRCVEAGTLPRPEMKSRRFVIEQRVEG